MLILVASDSFGYTLTADKACELIARGWEKVRPGDQVDMLPQSDGGPGFIEVLARSLQVDHSPIVADHSPIVSGRTTAGQNVPYQLMSSTIRGTLGDLIPAKWLYNPFTREAFIESATACGLQLLHGKPTSGSAVAASSYGLGQLIGAAIESGAQKISIGLGGSASNDGGRGLIYALAGYEPRSALPIDDSSLMQALALAQERTREVQLIAASDVDNPLLGSSGALRIFGPQKGARGEVQDALEKANEQWAQMCQSNWDASDHASPRPNSGSEISIPLAQRSGAGAAGGIGLAIFALGGHRKSGFDVTSEASGLAQRIAQADLVITGEGKLDAQSLHGKVIWAISQLSGQVGTPVIAIAGQVALTEPVLAQAGIMRSYSLSEHAGSVPRAISLAPEICFSLAQRVARDWAKDTRGK